MQHKSIGPVSVSEIGLGTWKYDAGPDPLVAGLAAGATWIDTAEMYGTEDQVGAAVRAHGGNAFVASKVSPQNLRPDALREAADRSLLALGLDVIDLYQVHWPNDDVPIAETMGAMERLVDAGKVRFLGVCNFSLALLDKAQASLSRHRLVSHQIHYSLIERRPELGMLRACRERGLAVLAYSPLGHGVARLTASDRHSALEAIAKQSGRTPAQIALAWCLRHPHVMAIPKASTPERVRENCAASGWRCDDGSLAALERAFPRPSRLETLARRVGGRVLRRMGLR